MNNYAQNWIRLGSLGQEGRGQGRQGFAATVVVLVVLREDGDDRAGVDQYPLSHIRSLPCDRGWC